MKMMFVNAPVGKTGKARKWDKVETGMAQEMNEMNPSVSRPVSIFLHFLVISYTQTC